MSLIWLASSIKLITSPSLIPWFCIILKSHLRQVFIPGFFKSKIKVDKLSFLKNLRMFPLHPKTAYSDQLHLLLEFYLCKISLIFQLFLIVTIIISFVIGKLSPDIVTSYDAIFMLLQLPLIFPNFLLTVSRRAILEVYT